MAYNRSVIIAAADGSSLANPGPSGWAWYIDDAHWAAGGWARGTNNMGELMSVLDLLRATKAAGQPLRVLCDSQYAINCCTRWIPAWKKRGWRKADNKPVANLDLLQQLDAELAGRNVTFQWVRGHAGQPLNERADQLARAAATAYQTGRPVAAGPGFGAAAPAEAAEPADEASPQAAMATPAADSDPAPVPVAVVPVAAAGTSTRRQPDQPDLLSLGQPDPRPAVADAGLVAHLTELTRQVIAAGPAADRPRWDDLVHPGYVAHLPGGVIRTKGGMAVRPAPASDQVQLDVIGADQLSDDCVLLRYRLRRDGRDYLSAAVWLRTAADWQVRFQQFTDAKSDALVLP